MASLAKATLLRLKETKGESGDTKRWAADGRAVAVRLNPTSLRFQRSNNVAPGESGDHDACIKDDQPRQPARTSVR